MAVNQSQEYHPGAIESGTESRPTRRALHSNRDIDDEVESIHSNEDSSLIHQSDDEDASSREPTRPHRRFGLLSTTFLMCVGVMKLNSKGIYSPLWEASNFLTAQVTQNQPHDRHGNILRTVIHCSIRWKRWCSAYIMASWFSPVILWISHIPRAR